MKNDRDRSIALAGLFQSAELARQIARHGMADASAIGSNIYSLFQTDPPSVEAVYGGSQAVTIGLETLLRQLEGGKGRDLETTRYVIALLHLERKLTRRKAMLTRIADGIGHTATRLEHFPMSHSNITAGLAEIYSQTISTLQPRVMVQGDPLYLQNPENVNRIRALLLAGVRSAMLWRQCGGGRLQILLGRSRLTRAARALLEETRSGTDPVS